MLFEYRNKTMAKTIMSRYKTSHNEFKLFKTLGGMVRNSKSGGLTFYFGCISGCKYNMSVLILPLWSWSQASCPNRKSHVRFLHTYPSYHFSEYSHGTEATNLYLTPLNYQIETQARTLTSSHFYHTCLVKRFQTELWVMSRFTTTFGRNKANLWLFSSKGIIFVARMINFTKTGIIIANQATLHAYTTLSHYFLNPTKPPCWWNS